MNDPIKLPTNRETSVVTPEHVMLRFQTAGLGSRAAAQLIDTVLLSLVNLTVFVLFILVEIGKSNWFLEAETDSEKWAMAIVVLFVFVFNFGYFLVLESFWSGQTVGKRLMGLRVIRDNGQPVTFLASAIRNLFRIVDGLPTGYFLGAIVSFFHPQDKRIGDLVAGTVVVSEGGTKNGLRNKPSTHLSHAGMLSTSLTLDERQKQKFTREDWQLLTSFLERMKSLSPDKRKELASQLANLYTTKLELAVDRQELADPVAFLQQLHQVLRQEWQLGAR